MMSIDKRVFFVALGVLFGGCEGVVLEPSEGGSQSSNLPQATDNVGNDSNNEGSVDDGNIDDGASDSLLNCQSNGSGGLKEDIFEQSFTASTGQTSNYHLYAAALDWNEPMGLAVILHGDGGGFYTSPQSGASGMVPILNEYNMLSLIVRTPDFSTNTWWLNGSDNVEFLSELIDQRVLEQYPINTDKVLIIGYSGGAEFTTIDYVPGDGEHFCGGAALVLGSGSPPSGNPEFSTDFKNSFKFHFYAGQNDQYLSDAQKGSEKYTSLGFTVTTEWPSGIGHATIPFANVLEEQLEKGLLNH
ncbi:MAG: hypothetical protein IPJ88_03270 [Myxococcales bacterium]|nr:MAG: hypothetical protein IPJ88_03270 [Myxococcales bacterium]